PPVGDIELWNIETGQRRALARTTGCFPGGAHFSPDGRRVVLVYHGKAHVFDTQTGKQRSSYAPPEEVDTHVVSFSPDGRSVLSYLFRGPSSPHPDQRQSFAQ